MTKTEFFCLVAGDMIGPKDMKHVDECGLGLVLSRRRLAKNRVQIIVQWHIPESAHINSNNIRIKYNSNDYGWGSFSKLQMLQQNGVKK